MVSGGGPRLIVHADDFGLSESVNKGIILAHEEGIVTSASVMPTAAASSAALDLSKTHPSLDIGIHLTLVGEWPALPAKAVPSLVRSNGKFHEHATDLAKLYLRARINLSEVRGELDAQIERVLTAGIQVSHLDSHQHVHLLPGILKVVVELANRHGIPAVRLPRERLRGYMLAQPGLLTRLGPMLVLNRLCSRAKLDGLETTEHFSGFFFGGRLVLNNLITVLTHLPSPGTCELMCHPAQAASGSHHEHWGYHGPEELVALTSPITMASIRDHGIRLISYREMVTDRDS